MELHLAPFNLPLTIESAVSLVRERAGRHGIALSLSVDDALGEVVADERKVRQILLNLLSNAVKFTPDGGRIETTAVRAATGQRFRSATPASDRAGRPGGRLREFRQVGGQHAQAREGTGLGWHSPSGSWSCTAGPSASRARSAKAPPLPSPYRCAHVPRVDPDHRGPRQEPEAHARSAPGDGYRTLEAETAKTGFAWRGRQSLRSS